MNAKVLFRAAGRRCGAAAGACLLALASCGGGGDSSPPRTEVIRIQNTGSDTMVNLAQEWAEAYKKVDPSVSVEVAGGGSSVGITQLQEGFVDLANASREMTEAERAEMKRKTGKEPVEWIVAYDGLAVYVHKDNPVEVMSLDELASIYGENGAAKKWSDLGIDNRAGCPSDEIIRVSRQSSSGTFQYFREVVLHKGDFKRGAQSLSGSKDVVDAVGKTPCAIGYSGMGYKDDHVKFVKIDKEKGGPAYEPSIASVLDKTYPIARSLIMYTAGQPTGPVKKYLEWIMSPAGQAIVAHAGYIPHSEQTAETTK
jgi:phosphate transport system substrate-binding protein